MNALKPKDKKVWLLKKDLIKRVGYISKYLKKNNNQTLKTKSDSVQTQSPIEDKYNVEKRAFILQLLSIEAPELHRTK